MATNLHGKKVHTLKMIRLFMSLLQQSRATMAIWRTFCFGLAPERKRERGQTKLDW
jgi:hypothetical protein